MNTLCVLSSLTSEQWAAWVQAIGSIAAIIAAIQIGRHQAQTSQKLAETQANRSDMLQTELHAQRYAELYSPPLAFAEIAIDEMEGMLRELVAPYYEGGFNASHTLTDRCDALVSAFAQLPIHSMPTVPSVKHLWSIQKLLAEAKQRLTEIGAKKDMLTTITSEDVDQFRACLLQIKGECDALKGNLVAATLPMSSVS